MPDRTLPEPLALPFNIGSLVRTPSGCIGNVIEVFADVSGIQVRVVGPMVMHSYAADEITVLCPHCLRNAPHA